MNLSKRRLMSIAASLLAVGAVAGVAVWIESSMVYVPAADEILAREALRPFLVEPADLTGVYANHEADSVVFRYTAGAGAEEFWTRVERQALLAGWRAVAPEGEVRRFERVTPPGGRWWSVEEVRVRYRAGSRAVVVGWVQGDSERAVAGLAECGGAAFAERVIWPYLRGE